LEEDLVNFWADANNKIKWIGTTGEWQGMLLPKSEEDVSFG